jgi:hypothetical protein
MATCKSPVGCAFKCFAITSHISDVSAQRGELGAVGVRKIDKTS